MEQYWTNERNEIPNGELEFWAMRRGLTLNGEPADTTESKEVECTALKTLTASARLGAALGFAMVAAVLAGRTFAGGQTTAAQLAVDVANGVTWSFLVCSGVGLGTAMARTHGNMVAALISMVAAGLATDIATDARIAVGNYVGVGLEPAMLTATARGVIHAVEFGVLGWMFASMAARQEPARRFVIAAAKIGLLFGGTIVLMTSQAAESMGFSLSNPRLAALSINEIVFPIGCAIVTFVALEVGRQIKWGSMPTNAK